jgi:flagellin
MALNVISNFAANVAHRHLTMSDKEASESVAKLSSGQRVLAAKDDAAALAIGTRLDAEEKALGQAGVNAGQAVSMLQIADGAMARTNDILVRMKTLAVQASSDQLSGTERGMLDDEFQALRDEIDRIADDTEFNGTALLAGGSLEADITTNGTNLNGNGIQDIEISASSLADTAGYVVEFDNATAANQLGVRIMDSAGGNLIAEQIITGVSSPGAGQTQTLNFDALGIQVTLNENFDDTAAGVAYADADNFADVAGGGTDLDLTFRVGTGVSATEDVIDVSITSSRAEDLDSALATGSSDITTVANAEAAMTAVTGAIDALAENRANLGASQNRLEFASENIATARENTEAARSDLMDLDVAKEMSVFTSKQILVQAGTSMLAQANQMPQNLLSLFR